MCWCEEWCVEKLGWWWGGEWLGRGGRRGDVGVGDVDLGWWRVGVLFSFNELYIEWECSNSLLIGGVVG